METKQVCPGCKKPLPPDVPLGLCPECLLRAGFNTGADPVDAGFVPPTIEEIARLFPQLEIAAFVGKGGMGAVYKARQPALDRFVALKILPPRVAAGPGFAERFNREARALARLTHPNIVAIHDFGQAGGLHYLVMEFVDGANLREVERAGRLAPEQALAIVPQICEALQFAHNEGVVHRDIKPENILIDKRGRVKITDFGIAKILGQTPEAASLTGAKDVIGTPHYMAPEQIEKPALVDHRADIFSLGVVFYEMLTGELPLGKFQPPSKKVQVDVRLDEIVLHALEKEPERRYQHASQVKTEVETVAGSVQAAVSPAGNQPATGVPRFSRRAIARFGCALFSFLPITWFFALVKESLNTSTPGGGGNWGNFLLGIIGFMGIVLVGPLLSSVLGWLAVAQIRHSAGRIGGLGLALFDVLLFPLLALDGVIGGLWLVAAKLVAVFVLGMRNSLFVNFPQALIWLSLAVGMMLWVNFLIVRRLWAIVKQPSNGPAGRSDASRERATNQGEQNSRNWTDLKGLSVFFSKRAFALLAIVGGIVLLLAAVALPGLDNGRMERLDHQRQEALEKAGGNEPATNRVARSTDQIVVEDVALRMLAAIRDREDDVLKSMAVEGVQGWPEALPKFAFEMRERFQQMTGKPFAMEPAESLVEDGRAVVKCIGPAELKGAYLTLFFVKTDDGWRNWLLRNAAPTVPLETFLKQKPPVTAARETLDVQPPVVVETKPVSGAADVESGVAEIRVRFSKKMADGSWSWSTAWENSTPEFIGKPGYESDHRTCVVKVRLEPGRTYAYWLNSEKFRNFVDEAGRPAVPYLLIFQTKQKQN